eukprot:scaffold4655_cov115-Isochrysis_galbana.AAC.3
MYKFDVRALTTYESDHTAANYGTTASHAPRLDGYHFQIEHECLIHHARLGGEDEIERALAGECGRERPNRLKTVSRVAQLLGHNDAPDAASRHPPDSLIDATNHRAVADREGQRRVQETIALECAALGLVPRLKGGMASGRAGGIGDKNCLARLVRGAKAQPRHGCSAVLSCRTWQGGRPPGIRP